MGFCKGMTFWAPALLDSLYHRIHVLWPTRDVDRGFYESLLCVGRPLEVIFAPGGGMTWYD